jgi:multiple sugar transport system permease protein
MQLDRVFHDLESEVTMRTVSSVRQKSLPSLNLKRVLGWLTMLIAVVFVVLYIFPYAYLFLTSFKPPAEAISSPPSLWPSRISFQNYASIGQHPYIAQAFLSSLSIALSSTLLSLMLAVPAAYGITRYGTLPGRIFMVVALCTRMVPYVSLAIPFFVMMKRFGLLDTQLAVMLAHTTINLPLAIWLMTSFFENFPFSIEEAARVDGCSRLGAIIRVVLPISAGGITVSAIFCFLTSWNEFLFSLLLTSVNAKTVPIAIAEFNTQYTVEWGTMAALAILFSLPVMIFSLFMQRRIVSGLTMGAVKQ